MASSTEQLTVDVTDSRVGAGTERIVSLLWLVARVIVGWVFLWAFVDKLVGAGLDTETGWIDGASPTTGFLTYGVTNPVGQFYADVAGGGGGWIDWVYMASMLAIGLGLVLGVLTRLAAAGGLVWMVLLYSATYAPERNPFVDQHVAYAVILVGVIVAGAGEPYGLGAWWRSRHDGAEPGYWLRG